MSWDKADAAVAPIFTILVAMIHLEAVPLVYGALDFGMTIIATSDPISLAHVLAVAALLYVASTNDWNKLTFVQMVLVILTFTVTLAPPIVPGLDGVFSNLIVSLFATMVSVLGYAAFWWSG